MEGNTYVALNEFAQQLAENGIQSELVWIGTKPVRGCIACNSCHDNRCVFNDDITNSIIAKMEECDGLVIGSTGLLRTASRTGMLSAATYDVCR